MTIWHLDIMTNWPLSPIPHDKVLFGPLLFLAQRLGSCQYHRTCHTALLRPVRRLQDRSGPPPLRPDDTSCALYTGQYRGRFRSPRNLTRNGNAPYWCEDATRHISEPWYCPNPVEGYPPLLVYQIFGWDILEELKECGFTSAYGKVYYGIKDGYLGYLPLYFEAKK